MRLLCHPERRRSSAKRRIFGVEGPAFLAGTSMQAGAIEKHSRSLHAQFDRFSIELLGRDDRVFEDVSLENR
jgi:hypothetical protein